MREDDASHRFVIYRKAVLYTSKDNTSFVCPKDTSGYVSIYPKKISDNSTRNYDILTLALSKSDSISDVNFSR